MRVLSHGLNECFYPVAIVTCNNNVTTVHIVPDQLMWNKKAKNCTVWTTRICIYQLTLVLCTVSVAREPKSNVLVFILGNTPPSEAWQRTGEFTVSFLGSDVSIIVLYVCMSSSLSTAVCYSTFIATLFTSYFMCQLGWIQRKYLKNSRLVQKRYAWFIFSDLFVQ